MFTYLTSNQLIIGLNDYHPLKRLIQEGRFKHIAFLHEQDEFGHALSETTKIIKLIESCNIPFDKIALDMRTNIITFNKNIDLIISYGSRYIHDIAKVSNTNACQLYTIETEPGHMSSCGAGLLWKGGKSVNRIIIPTVVFNSCHNVQKWNIMDKIYFLHDITLALEACFLTTKSNDFIKTCAYNGIIECLRLWKKISKTQSKSKLRKLYAQIAQADVLMKNAYNNAPLSPESRLVAASTEHYRQFEIVLAYESIDVIEALIRKRGSSISQALEFYGSSLEEFKTKFSEFYLDFTEDPKRWEVAGDILGKHLSEVMGKNQQTRRVV